MSGSAVRAALPVSASRHESSALMMPEDANLLGNVFGGAVMALMDKTAAVCAMRHARQQCVTVSVDRIEFREPIHVGELVVLKASVNFVGRSSMEVGVRVEAEDLRTGLRRHTNSCYLTFVAIDAAGRPAEVPAIIAESHEERRRYEAAQARRARRLDERAAEAQHTRAHAAAHAATEPAT
ncbi:MAG: acyl-CoA thioesterase [Gemmatimonadetes bacterium]|nr:acyl-CoA thioesterase [Gemmatimonadota bacterium]